MHPLPFPFFQNTDLKNIFYQFIATDFTAHNAPIQPPPAMADDNSTPRTKNNEQQPFSARAGDRLPRASLKGIDQT
jgi:hypothetical protein